MIRSRNRPGVLAATLAVLLIPGLLGLPACRRGPRLPDPGIPFASGTASPKLSTFVFKEEGKFYLMTVGVNATRFHEKDAFIPLAVTVANKQGPPLTIHRESFTLVDPISGSRYGLAGIDEVRRQGGEFQDARLMDRDHLALKLDIYQETPSNFFPFQGIVNDRIELHPFQFMLDNLYFPRPEGELLGRTFELHLDDRSLESPLFVVFTVPEA